MCIHLSSLNSILKTSKDLTEAIVSHVLILSSLAEEFKNSSYHADTAYLQYFRVAEIKKEQ